MGEADTQTGSSFANCTRARKQYLIVQGRQSCAVLHANYAADDRRRVFTVPDAPRVSYNLFSSHYIDPALGSQMPATKSFSTQ